MKRLCSAVLLAPLLAAACTAEPTLLAPDHVMVGGVELHMSAGVNRDFWCCVSDGSLEAAVLLTAPDSLTVPNSVIADSIWVVNGHDTWAAALAEVGRAQGYARFGAWGGPKWAPGTSVDIYVTLRDGSYRKVLEAANQPISTTF